MEAYRAGADRTAPTLSLHHLLERQHYKLGHWRLASSDINYRRFFDINTLAGLRVEDAGTFEAVHRLVKRLIAEGKLQGLRLDHIDGLRDPVQYFQRLRRLVREAHGGRSKPFYVVIEKILGEHEKLSSFAGVHGTTGYEWMNVITQVLTDGRGLEPLDEIWRQISNQSPKLEPILREAKRRVLETLLTSEFTVLTRLLARIASGHYSTRDYSADSLRQALELYVLHFPVYRTYLTSSGPSAHDRELISTTIERARADWFAADDGIFDFLRDTLTMDLLKPGRPPHSAPRVRRFALKVQQFTGPMMAKSLEDTTFYRYHRLLALNEVGGDPAAKSLSASEFHGMMQARAREWPLGMTATATHDTKRGEDARARIMALAEMPGEWTSAVARWKLLNAPHLSVDGDLRAPSATFEYMLYQALLGAWQPDRRLISGADAGICPQSRARGQAGNELAQSPRRLRDRRQRLHRKDSRSFALGRIPEFAASAGAAAVAAGRTEFAQPDHAEGDDAGRAGFLSGHRALGFFTGRSRQPAAGRFCRTRRPPRARWRIRIGASWSRSGRTVI